MCATLRIYARHGWTVAQKSLFDKSEAACKTALKTIDRAIIINSKRPSIDTGDEEAEKAFRDASAEAKRPRPAPSA